MSNPAATGTIAWSNAPAPHRAHVGRVLSPRPGDILIGAILSNQIVGVLTHFMDGRSSPHIEPAQACEPCKLTRQRPRWKGYLSAFVWGTSRICVFELTEGAYLADERLRDPEFDLRGWVIRVERMTAHKRARVRVEWKEKIDASKLPPACDVVASLEVLWGLRPNEWPSVDPTAKGGD